MKSVKGVKNEICRCSIVQDLLPLYVEDMVRPDTERYVRDHLAECPACRDELANLKEGTHLPLPPDAPASGMAGAEPFKDMMKRVKKRHILAAVLAVVGSIVLYGLTEWALKQPIRRDLEYYSDYSIEETFDGIYFYANEDVSGLNAREVREPLWFDYENRIVHLKRIIYCETSPWEAVFGGGSDDQNWLAFPLDLDGRGKGEAPFPKSCRFYDGEAFDYRYDEVWYEDRDGTLHLIWSIND